MSTTWYLRTDQGVIFGPAGISMLREWAEQGRIGPESQLSDDRKSWVPAHTLTELEMNWMFDLGTGMIGPVNLRALRDLVLDGVVPSTTQLVHRQTKTKQPLFQKLDQVFGQPATPPQINPPPAGGATLDTAPTAQIAKLEARLQQAAEQNTSLSAELQAARDLLETERRQAELGKKELHQAVQQAENSRTAAASALKAETRKAEDYRHQLESVEKLLAQAKSDSATTSQQLQELQQEHDKAARRQSEADEAWRLSLSELRSALDAERAAATAVRKSATEQAESFLARADAWRKTEQELRGELTAAADALGRAKADIDGLSSNHSLQMERGRQSEEKLRKALEAAQAELSALRIETTTEERRLRSALDESARELAHVRNSLRASETAHAAERESRQQQSIASTQSDQVLRVEHDRLVHRITELEARGTRLATERDNEQTRLMTLIRETEQKDATHSSTMHELLQQLAHASREKELLEARLDQSEAALARLQASIQHSAPHVDIPAERAAPEPRTVEDNPPSEQPQPSSNRPEVHEPEILRPLSSAPPPNPDMDEAKATRPSHKTTEAPWSRESVRRSAGKSDSKSATLADIEAQVQRDLLAWQKGKSSSKRARHTDP